MKVKRSKVPRKFARPVQERLQLGNVGAVYKAMPLTRFARSKLASYLKMDDTVDAAVPPRTCTQMAFQMAELLRIAVRQGLLRRAKCDSYFGPWLFRSFLIALARHRGVLRMRIGNMTALQFSNMCPDQNGWAQRLCSRAGVAKSLVDFGYNGPPELFSMYACLFSDTSLAGVDPVVMRHQQVLLKRKLREYMQQYGLSPHPVVLLQKSGLELH